MDGVVYPDYVKTCTALGKVPFPKPQPGAKGPAPEFHPDKYQVCILNYDCYSVHMSKEMAAFLKQEHPYVRIVMIPAGCTGTAQIPDLMLNRPFKVAMKDA